MKTFLLFIGFLISAITFASAQKDTAGALNISKLLAQGLWLSKGWKFYTGDDPAFANPGYNDQNWQAIDPTRDVNKLPARVKDGIGWMRIKMRVSESVWKNASLRVINIPAIEIYIDGQLICKRGIINASQKTARGYFDHLDPVALPATLKTDHVIAVRYCMDTEPNFFNQSLYPIAFAGLQFLNTASFNTIKKQFWYFQISDIASASVLFLLAIFHFTLYRYNRINKGNVYFAAYALCFGLYLITAYVANFDNYTNVFTACIALGNLVVIISLLFCLKALYTLFNFNSGKFFIAFAIVVIAQTLVWLFVDGIPQLVGYGLFVFILVIEFWLTIKAVWLKKRGANIIAIGFFAGLCCAIVYELANTGQINIPFLLFLAASSAIVLGPVLAISVYLGKEFALDGLLLQAKLTKVEELSAKTIVQEQEKQLLLEKQNELLEQQVRERTADLNQSLTNLKVTQSQLIQSEKMASLGELTAGIAHEIQNPLNFVNNFSEVNIELINEMETEMANGDKEEVIAILEDVKQNLEKISHHGKRADNIVKGMLQHSRASSNTKEPTDINELADEYLRLAYHGLRAKDKTFNSELIVNFSNQLPLVNIVPQDIGRVVLNLFTNAFYAVHQKQKIAAKGYQPAVTLSTGQDKTQVTISVKDNGNGIPANVKDKIMQPFFTTKPTGEGTGLGLSMSYEIIKAHEGSIEVESVEGEYTEFIVKLPI